MGAFYELAPLEGGLLARVVAEATTVGAGATAATSTTARTTTATSAKATSAATTTTEVATATTTTTEAAAAATRSAVSRRTGLREIETDRAVLNVLSLHGFEHSLGFIN